MILERLRRAWAAWRMRNLDLEKLVLDLESQIELLRGELDAATDHENVIEEIREQNASLTRRLLGIRDIARERMTLLEEIEDQVFQYRSKMETTNIDGDEK